MPRLILPEERLRRVTAYLACQTDGEAAARCGLSTLVFRGWRLREGLPARTPRGRPARTRRRTPSPAPPICPADVQARLRALTDQIEQDLRLARPSGLRVVPHPRGGTVTLPAASGVDTGTGNVR